MKCRAATGAKKVSKRKIRTFQGKKSLSYLNRQIKNMTVEPLRYMNSNTESTEPYNTERRNQTKSGASTLNNSNQKANHLHLSSL
jgi:hypothetical protein